MTGREFESLRLHKIKAQRKLGFLFFRKDEIPTTEFAVYSCMARGSTTQAISLAPSPKKSHKITGLATHVFFRTQLQTSGHHLRTRSANQLHEAQPAAQQANEAKILASPRKQKLQTIQRAQQTRSWTDIPNSIIQTNSSLYGTESNHCHPTKAKRKSLI
ncbi:hypothetical protein ACR777_21270 [Sphingobacterium spiritivorum]|uniref:hypothetical protein n=1 Tax=Sphingobacterium spiritivorum TaxID=258 RepID=UPI003DA36493